MESNEQSMQIAHLKIDEINRFLNLRRPVQVHICERESEEEREILLPRMENVGCGGDPVGLEEVQAPINAHIVVVH